VYILGQVVWFDRAGGMDCQSSSKSHPAGGHLFSSQPAGQGVGPALKPLASLNSSVANPELLQRFFSRRDKKFCFGEKILLFSEFGQNLTLNWF
jgi:hypothetical protein